MLIGVQVKYQNIILDFEYFKKSEYYDNLITTNLVCCAGITRHCLRGMRAGAAGGRRGVLRESLGDCDALLQGF